MKMKYNTNDSLENNGTPLKPTNCILKIHDQLPLTK